MKVHQFTDLKKNTKSLISLSYANGKRSNWISLLQYDVSPGLLVSIYQDTEWE